ncbi:MAG TPA: histidine kinase dimerization/phospho-acceptor domain-containing protein, partial [Xanthomonadales bacterium]|nr:histidine kinase dimerization/phospho-acceptor domain-containing protein [Xanthomonadales bacterium]
MRSLRARLLAAYGAVLAAGVATLVLAALGLHEVYSAPDVATEAERSFGTLFWGLLALTGLGLALVSMATWNIAHELGGKFLDLARATERLEQGDYGLALPHTGVHEIDLLAERMERMGRTLDQLDAQRLRALIAEKLRVEAVLNGIGEGLLLIDASGAVERVNPVARELLAPHVPERGAPLPEALREGPLGRALAAPGNARRAGELELAGTHGARTLEFAVDALGGEGAGLVVVLRDVSAERAFARKRSDFVLRAAHELRTPLTGLSMGSALLEERMHPAPGSPEHTAFATIRKEMARSLALIDRLLELARLYAEDPGSPPVARAPATLLEAAAARHADAARAKSVALEVHADSGLPEIPVHEALLGRALDELLRNALRATPDGGCVQLRATRAARGGESVRLEVGDGGPGVP